MRRATVVRVSVFPCSDDVVPESVTLLPLPDVAEQLGLPVTRVHQMLRDHQLLAVRRAGVAGVPKDFFDSTGAVVKPLPGLITVMRDAKYTDEEILGWIYTDDTTLPGRPVDAIHGPLAREVLRRAAAEPF
ncbi:Rv2175c family DNA-binding protein [Nocardia sp. BMG51109]|uniref:Rv2175c family DNA-binding protein n=1 Tax=Nocardia sp. BMG51109 TaxID=1056816 RepID=UPI0012EB1C70|nr:Rv2175c family DNA-binding protein [Nocardia sp. BMG51109]